MANKIILKRSSTGNSVPSAGDLDYGELALNYQDGNLFFKDAGNTIQTIASLKFVSVTGDVTGNNIQTGNQGSVRYFDADSSNYVAFKAPATVSANVTWTLPSADASTSGYVLTSDGAGTLTWAAVQAAPLPPFYSDQDFGSVVEAATQESDLGLVTEAATDSFDLGGFYYSSLQTTGNIVAGGYFVGDGSFLTNINATGGFFNSTLVSFPGSDGNSDYGNGEPYVGDSVTVDAFGISLIANYDCSDPLGREETTDLGVLT